MSEALSRRAQEFACANIARFARGGYLRTELGEVLAEFVQQEIAQADEQLCSDCVGCLDDDGYCQACDGVPDGGALTVWQAYKRGQSDARAALAKASPSARMLVEGGE